MGDIVKVKGRGLGEITNIDGLTVIIRMDNMSKVEFPLYKISDEHSPVTFIDESTSKIPGRYKEVTVEDGKIGVEYDGDHNTYFVHEADKSTAHETSAEASAYIDDLKRLSGVKK